MRSESHALPAEPLEIWDLVLRGIDIVSENPSAIEDMLVGADRETVRLVLRGFEPSEDLLARWQNVVDRYACGPDFDQDRVSAALQPYLDQVRRLATETGHTALANAARYERIRFDDAAVFEASELHLDWLRLVDDVVAPARPTDWRELEYRALRLVMHPVAYLDELLFYMLKPLEPTVRFDPDHFYAVWSGNATATIDHHEVRINRRVGPSGSG